MTWILIVLLVVMAIDMAISAVQTEARYNRVRTTREITATRICAILYVLVLIVAIVAVNSR